jgi:hypothetical protein
VKLTGQARHGIAYRAAVAQPVALVGIDCKRGVELAPFDPRLSALATEPHAAAELLPVLVKEMEHRYDLIKARQGIAPGWRSCFVAAGPGSGARWSKDATRCGSMCSSWVPLP